MELRASSMGHQVTLVYVVHTTPAFDGPSGSGSSRTVREPYDILTIR